jgi:uncharacterized delta-60 repeat protein
MKIRRTFLVVLAAAAVIAGTGCIGNLDPTFGNGGVAAVHVTESGATQATALQPDGKVVVVGWNQTSSDYTPTGSTVARIDTHGALDPSFGTGGKVTLPSVIVRSVALTRDGRIVLAGSDSSQHPLLAMLQWNGHYDTGFNSTGKLVPTFSAPITYFLSVTVRAGSAANHSDDEILASGGTGNTICTPGEGEGNPTCVTDFDPFVADFARTGAPVSSFGTNGVAILPMAPAGWSANSVSVSGAGIVFLAGAGCNTMVVRLTNVGAPDPGFSGDGIATFSGGAAALCGNDLAVGPGGVIAVVGRSSATPTFRPGVCLVTRLNADGSEDQTFGNSDARLFSFGPVGQRHCTLTAVAFDGDRIVAAGEGRDTAGIQPFNHNLLVARFDATGAFDKTFTSTGYTQFGDYRNIPVVDVAVGSRGYVVAFQTTWGDGFGHGYPLAVARFISH